MAFVGDEDPQGSLNLFTIGTTTTLPYKYRTLDGSGFKCHQCPATFSDMRQIKTHWHTGHSFRHPAHCVVCKLPFPNRQEVDAHRKSAHGFSCPECAAQFKKEVGLKAHVRDVHERVLQFRCSICNVSFDKKNHLLQHVEAEHENEDGFKVLRRCDECHERFLTEQDLMGHMLTHQENIQCDRCDLRFQSKGGLRRHYGEKHPGFKQPRL